MAVDQPASKNQTSSWFHLEFCCRLTRNYANINEKHVRQKFICWTLNFGANSLPLDSETCNSSAPSETTDLWSVFRLCPVESSLLTPQMHRNADQSFLWIRWERDFFSEYLSDKENLQASHFWLAGLFLDTVQTFLIDRCCHSALWQKFWSTICQSDLYQSDGWTNDGEQSAHFSGPLSLLLMNLFKWPFVAVEVYFICIWICC